MATVFLPALVGPILFLLLGVGCLVCGFLAPAGRATLTIAGGTLVLLHGLINLLLSSLFELLADAFGFETAAVVSDALSFGNHLLLGVGLILVVVAATRRPAEPAAPPFPGTPDPRRNPPQPDPSARH